MAEPAQSPPPRRLTLPQQVVVNLMTAICLAHVHRGDDSEFLFLADALPAARADAPPALAEVMLSAAEIVAQWRADRGGAPTGQSWWQVLTCARRALIALYSRRASLAWDAAWPQEGAA